MISSVITQGLAGMQRSQSAMLGRAQEIAGAGNTPPNQERGSGRDLKDLSTAIVDLKQQQHLFDASARVVAVGNHTLGSLLNATA